MESLEHRHLLSGEPMEFTTIGNLSYHAETRHHLVNAESTTESWIDLRQGQAASIRLTSVSGHLEVTPRLFNEDDASVDVVELMTDDEMLALWIPHIESSGRYRLEIDSTSNLEQYVDLDVVINGVLEAESTHRPETELDAPTNLDALFFRPHPDLDVEMLNLVGDSRRNSIRNANVIDFNNQEVPATWGPTENTSNVEFISRGEDDFALRVLPIANQDKTLEPDAIFHYDPADGRVQIKSTGPLMTTVQMESKSGIFTGLRPAMLDGPFDVHRPNKVFRLDLRNVQEFDFGPIAIPGLTQEFLQNDLIFNGSKLPQGILTVAPSWLIDDLSMTEKRVVWSIDAIAASKAQLSFDYRRTAAQFVTWHPPGMFQEWPQGHYIAMSQNLADWIVVEQLKNETDGFETVHIDLARALEGYVYESQDNTTFFDPSKPIYVGINDVDFSDSTLDIDNISVHSSDYMDRFEISLADGEIAELSITRKTGEGDYYPDSDTSLAVYDSNERLIASHYNDVILKDLTNDGVDDAYTIQIQLPPKIDYRLTVTKNMLQSCRHPLDNSETYILTSLDQNTPWSQLPTDVNPDANRIWIPDISREQVLGLFDIEIGRDPIESPTRLLTVTRPAEDCMPTDECAFQEAWDVLENGGAEFTIIQTDSSQVANDKTFYVARGDYRHWQYLNVSFSTPIRLDTVDVDDFQWEGPAIVSVDFPNTHNGASTVRLNLSEPLGEGEFELFIDENRILDLFGNPIRSTTREFETIPPRIESFSIKDESVFYSETIPLQILTNEPTRFQTLYAMNLETESYEEINLYSPDGGLTHLAEFTLPAGRYELQIFSGLYSDNHGNYADESFTVRFTIAKTNNAANDTFAPLDNRASISPRISVNARSAGLTLHLTETDTISAIGIADNGSLQWRITDSAGQQITQTQLRDSRNRLDNYAVGEEGLYYVELLSDVESNLDLRFAINTSFESWNEHDSMETAETIDMTYNVQDLTDFVPNSESTIAAKTFFGNLATTNDTDWYTVTVPANEMITLSATRFIGAGRIEVEVFNGLEQIEHSSVEDGSLIAPNNAYHLRGNETFPQTYYVSVRGAGDYSLSLAQNAFVTPDFFSTGILIDRVSASSNRPFYREIDGQPLLADSIFEVFLPKGSELALDFSSISPTAPTNLEPIIYVGGITTDRLHELSLDESNRAVYSATESQFVFVAIDSRFGDADFLLHSKIVLDDAVDRFDFDASGSRDIQDLNILEQAIRRFTTSPDLFDLNNDRRLNLNDFYLAIEDGFSTTVGDVNLDGKFDHADLNQVYQTGHYNSIQPTEWQTGDFDFDGVFTSRDIVLAFQRSQFDDSAIAAAIEVDDEESDSIRSSKEWRAVTVSNRKLQ